MPTSEFKTLFVPYQEKDFSLANTNPLVTFGASMGLKTSVSISWEGPYDGDPIEAQKKAKLRVILECEGGDPESPEEEVRIQIDTVGDHQAHLEIGTNTVGKSFGAVYRRTRTGYRKNSLWSCDDLGLAIRSLPDGRVGWVADFAIPFAAISNDLDRPLGEWWINFKRISPCEGGAEFTQMLQFAKLHFAGLTKC